MYTIGFNMVGYLPEMEPYTVDTADEAKRAMIDEMDRIGDQIFDGGNDTINEASTISLAMEDLNLTDVSDGWSDIIGNMSYWIVRTEVSDE